MSSKLTHADFCKFHHLYETREYKFAESLIEIIANRNFCHVSNGLKMEVFGSLGVLFKTIFSKLAQTDLCKFEHLYKRRKYKFAEWEKKYRYNIFFK